MDSSDVLTNAWSTKSLDLTNQLRILCTRRLKEALMQQSYGSICNAHAEIGSYILAISLRPDMLNAEKQILNELEICLYGSASNMETHKLWMKYQIKVLTTEEGQKVVVNAPILIGWLNKIFTDASIAAYKQNLVLPVPYEKKTGTRRLSEVFES